MDNNWLEILETFWLRITNDIRMSLKLVQRDFQSKHLSFDDKFKEYFLEKTNSRIAFTFEEFVNNSLVEEQYSLGFHSTDNDMGFQSQNDTAKERTTTMEWLNQSTHQTDQNFVAFQTSIVNQMNHTAIGSNDSISFHQNSARDCLESTSLSFTANQSTERFHEGYEEQLVSVDIVTSLNQLNQLPGELDYNNESFQFEESKCIDSNEITSLIRAKLGYGSLLAAQTNDDHIKKEWDSIEDSSSVDASANEPQTNNQEVTTHDYEDLGLADNMISVNDNRKQTEERMCPNEHGIEMVRPVAADVAHVTDQCSTKSRNSIKKSDSLPQKRIQPKKWKNSNELSTGNLNKKRKLATDSNETKQFKCEHCVYATSHKGNFNTHMRKHSDEKPFKCEICARGFTQKGTLNSHMRTHAKQFPFQCSICCQGFSLEQKLKFHEKNCNQKCYECYLCKYMCFQKGNLENHMRIHSGDTPFKCAFCARQFNREEHLKRHMRTHANQFPFHCSICRQGFSRKREKKSHEKSCNQKRFECYLCKYVSLRKEHVVRHMRKHTGKKPFHCSECRKQFACQSNLNMHTKRHHTKK